MYGDSNLKDVPTGIIQHDLLRKQDSLELPKNPTTTEQGSPSLKSFLGGWLSQDMAMTSKGISQQAGRKRTVEIKLRAIPSVPGRSSAGDRFGPIADTVWVPLLFHCNGSARFFAGVVELVPKISALLGYAREYSSS